MTVYDCMLLGVRWFLAHLA